MWNRDLVMNRFRMMFCFSIIVFDVVNMIFLKWKMMSSFMCGLSVALLIEMLVELVIKKHNHKVLFAPLDALTRDLEKINKSLTKLNKKISKKEK